MSAAIEARVGRLLSELLAGRGATQAAVAESSGVPLAEVERLLAGGGPLDLGRLERVLAVLGAPAAEFFGRLYAPPSDQAPDRAAGEPAAAFPAAGAGRRPAPLPRQEIEALLRELRGMIDGMVRVIDAEHSLDHPDEP
jgi:transcriptional regulator with XRE-family HTH domain